MAVNWARVNELFHLALEQPRERRDEFLSSSCDGDDDLRREIVSLLAASDRADSFMEAPAAVTEHPLAGERELLPAGQLVGHYRVQRVLGEGGMGVVYLADDTRLGRPVALKALPPRFTADAGRRERLAREARAAAGLTHPGIATVYALEEFDGQLYIACEYVPGETLRAELERGPLAPAAVIDAGLGISHALSAAHDRGITHRDLKPENLIRTPAGTLKILDFGLARFRDQSGGRATLTGDGMLIGTPAYMSPEQIRGEAASARADIFSLGIVLYELASGVNPFEGRDSASTIARILETEAPPLAGAGRASDAASLSHLDPVILTCLRKTPDARYRSTAELIDALERARVAMAAGRPAPRAAMTPGPIPPSGAVSARQPRWWWEFHQIAASVAYAVLLAPLWYVHVWCPGRGGVIVFLMGLASALGAATLRLHFVFAVRSYPEEHGTQERSTRRWVRVADTLFAAMLLAGAGFVLTLHDSVAAILVGAAVAVVVSSVVIEPATTRAAFGARG